MTEPSPIKPGFDSPVALVTGAARRVGACLARRLHRAGYRVVVHYNRSQAQAELLVAELNQIQPATACCLSADLNDPNQVRQLASRAREYWQRLDLLVNNASTFYPTPLSQADQNQWDDLIGSNLQAPLWLSQALADELQQREGVIINIVDVHAQRPLKGFSVYSVAKAGLAMLTQSLAKELAPRVRVNGVAPGPILPPEGASKRDKKAEQQALDSTLLRRYGCPDDIADAVLFLAGQNFITGQILAVDGGKSVC